MKMCFSSESFHVELTGDKVYSSKMLAQIITCRQGRGCVKKIAILKKMNLLKSSS